VAHGPVIKKRAVGGSVTSLRLPPARLALSKKSKRNGKTARKSCCHAFQEDRPAAEADAKMRLRMRRLYLKGDKLGRIRRKVKDGKVFLSFTSAGPKTRAMEKEIKNNS
jgi:hypothetical protein